MVSTKNYASIIDKEILQSCKAYHTTFHVEHVTAGSS